MSPAASAVLFDRDGTLHDRDRAFRAWANGFARDRLRLAEIDAADAVASLVDLDTGGRGPKEAMFAAARDRRPILHELPADLVATFRADLRSHVALDPAAARLLTALDAVVIPWGIVTNGSATQHEKLAVLEIAGRSPCVVVSEEVGLRKPDPAIFLLAAQCLGVDPAATLFLGDHPAYDIARAAAAGMRTAWLGRGAPWPEAWASSPPDLILGSLDELWHTIAPGEVGSGFLSFGPPRMPGR